MTTSSTNTHWDVIVIGAGPAGSAVAKLLSECGHRVLLIERGERATAPRRALAESLPPSTKKTLSALGLLNAVDAAGFQPWRGNTVWWAGADARLESFSPGESGYQVDRARFDALLREHAIIAGTTLMRGLVREVDDDGAVIVEVDDEARAFTATFLLDCSGRAGVIARAGLRETEPSHHTVALCGVWQANAPWPRTQEAHTLVASYTDGWAWSVPTSADVRYVTVMVDPERTRLARGAGAMDVYRTELAKVAPFAPWIDAATLVDGPWGADATLYCARRYAGDRFLLVGDAGSFIDPLSSCGVKKALTSAWLAAIAVNTAIKTPSMREEAFAFFDRREREVHASFTKLAAAFALDAAAGSGHTFWQARAASADGIDVDVGADPVELARDPSVRAALADLQQRPNIRLRLGEDVRVESCPAVQELTIVMREHLIVPLWPTGVRYLRNIDLLQLCRRAELHADVGALYETSFREQPGISLPDFLGALSTLIARGVLVHR